MNPRTLALGIFLLPVLVLSGCSSSNVRTVHANVSEKIPRGTCFYVVTPANGSYDGREYSGSGATVAAAFDSALSPFADSVVIGPACRVTADALAEAKAKKCAYVVIPKITRWEDRATEWSGIRDKMELFVKVYRVEDGKELVGVEVLGKSSWVTMGGDHPEDLVKAPVSEFVSGLF